MYLHVVDGALMLAQVLAGIGTNGINLSNLGSGLGKRDITEAESRFLVDAMTQAFGNIYTNVIQKPLEGAIASESIGYNVCCYD
jgi:hypothetical protein